MATIPEPKQTARHILEIFVFHFNCRPGHALSQNNFYKIWRGKGLHDDDFGPEMDYAAEKGWVEIFDRGFSYRLTDAGFQEADIQHDHSTTKKISDADDKSPTSSSVTTGFS